jgi:lysophospholipase L1-like esterase
MKLASKIALAVSLSINLLAVAAFARTISARGGLTYLQYFVERYIRQSIPDPHRSARETIFESLSHPRRGAVVFVGDSLTDWNEWPEFFSEPGRILNRGIGGQTSAGVRRNAKQIAGLDPVAVFLMIGANDAIGDLPATQTVANIRETVGEIQELSPETHVYVQSLLPFRMLDRRDWIRQVNESLKSWADGETVFFVDVYGRLADEDGYLDAAYTVDGVHLNAKGYEQWLGAIRDTVELELHRDDVGAPATEALDRTKP